MTERKVFPLKPVIVKTETMYGFKSPVVENSTIIKSPVEKPTITNHPDKGNMDKFKELFTALFKIKDVSLQARIMSAINGMPITCPKCNCNLIEYKSNSPIQPTISKTQLISGDKKHVQISVPSIIKTAPTIYNNTPQTNNKKYFNYIPPRVSCFTQTLLSDFEFLDKVNGTNTAALVTNNKLTDSLSKPVSISSLNNNSGDGNSRIYRLKNKRQPHAVKHVITINNLHRQLISRKINPIDAKCISNQFIKSKITEQQQTSRTISDVSIKYNINYYTSIIKLSMYMYTSKLKKKKLEG